MEVLEKDARLAVIGRRGRLLEEGSDDSTTLADRRRSTEDEDPFIERLGGGPRRGRGEVAVVEDLEGGPEVNP